MSKLNSETMRIETAIRLARAIEKHSESNDAEAQEVAKAACGEGVSTFDSLRALILLRVAKGNTQLLSQWLKDT